MAGKNIIDVTDATFEQDVIQRSHEKTVVVDFWAPWCGPCRMLGPILERLANEPDTPFTLAKINVDHNPQYAQQFQVQGIPAVKAFRNGKMVGGFVGAQPEPNVRRFIAEVAPSEESDRIERLLAQGKWDAAARLMQRALTTDPDQTDLRLRLAQAYLRLGKGCEAVQQLQAFPVSAEYEAAQRLAPLAALMCDALHLREGDSEVDRLYLKAANQISSGDYRGGAYNLLSIVRHDKTYREGQAKDAMLGLFTLLGEDNVVTKAYRNQLASALW